MSPAASFRYSAGGTLHFHAPFAPAVRVFCFVRCNKFALVACFASYFYVCLLRFHYVDGRGIVVSPGECSSRATLALECVWLPLTIANPGAEVARNHAIAQRVLCLFRNHTLTLSFFSCAFNRVARSF